MRRARWLLPLVILLVLLPLTSMEEQPAPAPRGRAPIEGARLLLWEEGTRPANRGSDAGVVAEARSDAGGHFEFDVPAGS